MVVRLKARHRAGYEILIDAPDLNSVDVLVDELQDRGYRPAVEGDGFQRTPSGEPICPRHNISMSRRSKQDDEWWSHRVIDTQTGQDKFCRGYPHGPREKDGYFV